RNPFKLNRLIGVAVKNVTIDSEMSTKDIFRLGRRFRSLDPDAVDMVTLPTVGARIAGADVLRLKQPDAGAVIARFNSLTPEASSWSSEATSPGSGSPPPARRTPRRRRRRSLRRPRRPRREEIPLRISVDPRYGRPLMVATAPDQGAAAARAVGLTKVYGDGD